jgi:RNA-directed DNA polymerase
VQFEKNGAVDKGMMRNMCPDAEGNDGSGPQAREELQMLTARTQTETLKTDRLMELVCHETNIENACKRVKSNKGSAGIDGMDVRELERWLKEHGSMLKDQLLTGDYHPQPVRRVEIPKPNGGRRQLGIPTVIDRMVQQALLQTLTPIFDPYFSESSYGFRPGKSAHQAILKAQEYVAAGRGFVVDIDLEKFFDKVNHDKLMARVARKVEDKRVLRLIRSFLQVGAVMPDGVCVMRQEGTPQGGPLSPLLANIILDDLDKELERRGHKFCRYADDCNIYVNSLRAGERVMLSVTEFLEKNLRLKVNREKSAVAPSSGTQVPGVHDILRDACHS